MKDRKKPAIRFKGFTEDWEQRKLGELCFLVTKGTTPLDKSSIGTVNFVKIESIDEVSGEIKITQKITDEEHNGYLRRSQLKKGDILFSIAGTLGRVTAVKSCILPANTNQALAIIRLKSGCLQYIKTYLKGKAVADFIEKNPTIGAQPNLSLEQVGNLEISLPTESEQKFIGAYFQHLDNLITLHQRKYDKLVNIKKSVLEKMFPRDGKIIPDIRFSGFTEDWEQRKLENVADIAGGGTPSTAISEYWDGDIDWYAPAEIAGQIFVNSSQKKITTEGLNNSSAKMLPVGTVIFTSRAGIGKTAILTKEGCTNQGFQSIIPHKDELDSYFIFSRTDELKRYGETIGAGSTFVEVSGKQMANMTISIPATMVEQRQIGTYFRNLDNLIALHQRKLEKFKNIKKSCLEKMFI